MGKNGRAETPADKREILDNVNLLWNMSPDMRLGQLIYNSVVYWMQQNSKFTNDRQVSRSVFYLEDDDLLTTIALFVKDHYPPAAWSSTSS